MYHNASQLGYCGPLVACEASWNGSESG